jgi:hypothetical protein
MAPDGTNTWRSRHSGLLRAICSTTTADKAGKKGTEFEAGDVPYPNLKVARQHVIAMRRRLLVALWKLHCYNGLDPSLWLPLCHAMMPCNTIAFEGYVHFDVLASVNAVR